MSPSPETAANDGDIRATVRTSDPDGYVAALYAPEATRPALLALRAFDLEIRRLRWIVREPMAGEIRLQWWRDALDGGEGQTGHPLADALREAMGNHGLPFAAFDGYLAARVFDLYDDPMPDRTTLEGYCGETDGAMIQLAALVLDPGAAAVSGTLAGHAGCASAIAAICRQLPEQRARGQCFVPGEILAAAGLDRDGFLAGADARAMEAVVGALAALAAEHLAAFEQGAGDLPVSLRPAFLPMAVTRRRIDLIDPAKAWKQHAREPSLVGRHWRIFRRASRGWPRAV